MTYLHLIKLSCVLLVCLASTLSLANEKLDQAAALLSKGNYKASYQLLNELVENNDALAMLLKGSFYENGYLGTTDIVEACRLYKRSALQNIPLSLDKAARCLLDIDGTFHSNKVSNNTLSNNTSSDNTPNPKSNKSRGADRHQLAVEYYTKAAQAGHHISYCNLADYYYSGTQLQQDIPKALSLCEQSALQGSPPAMLNLAKMYLQAPKAHQNIEQAIKWFSLAAEYKIPEAFYYLGHLFEKGLGTDIDMPSALLWYEKAAEAGHKPAYLATAQIYFNAPRQANTGKWQEVALAKAYLWLSASVSANPNEGTSTKMLSIVKQELPKSWRASLDQQIAEHFKKLSTQ